MTATTTATTGTTIPPMGVPISQHPTARKGSSAVAKIEQINFMKLLEMPGDLKVKTWQFLANRDVVSFEIALSDNLTYGGDPTTYFAIKQLSKLYLARIYEITLKKIFKDNPNWISKLWLRPYRLEDLVWLMQLYELHQLQIKIPTVESFFKERESNALPTKAVKSDAGSNGTAVAPFSEFPKLLEQRGRINLELGLIDKLDLRRYSFIKTPHFLNLFGNLQYLATNSNGLRMNLLVDENVNLKVLSCAYHVTPPDVSQNVNLVELEMIGSVALKQAPDLHRNRKLGVFRISHANLSSPPELGQNVNLRVLSIISCSLKVWPNLRANRSLTELTLQGFQLTTLPDITMNGGLEVLDLSNNELVVSPDVSRFRELRVLKLDYNALDAAPNVTSNPKLTKLTLAFNRIKKGPDLSKNDHLKEFDIRGNPLSEEDKKKLAAKEAANKGCKISY